MDPFGALPQPGDDPDPTDRLPELDPQSVQLADDPLERTGNFTGSTGGQAAAVGDLERTDRRSRPDDEHAAVIAELERELAARDTAIAGMTTALREKTFALTRVEKELEQTRSELMRARQAAVRVAELERRLEDAERERLELAARYDEQRDVIGRLENQLSEARELEQGIERKLEEERAARQRTEEALARQSAPVRGLPPAGQPTPRRCLTRLDGGGQVTHVLAQPRTTIGRTPENDLQVRESYISRSHAVIRLGPESAVIEDLGSRNGVFVNDRRVMRERLRDGDTVMFGKARFRFHLEPAEHA